ncbi:E3 ubiquitin-protein ligase CSU1-like protein [Drosera capensis]
MPQRHSKNKQQRSRHLHIRRETKARIRNPKGEAWERFDQALRRLRAVFEAQCSVAKSYTNDKNGFHGANSVKVTSYEEEALRTMKAFWLPSATPDAPVKVQAPSTFTTCPEGKEKLKLKSFFPIHFTEANNDYAKKSKVLERTNICPSCKVTLTNTMTLVALSTCGHVFCKKCSDKFMATEKVCLVCNTPCKEKNLVTLEKGGTGFASHDDNLEATAFKHLGSGSGLGMIRPAAKT